MEKRIKHNPKTRNSLIFLLIVLLVISQVNVFAATSTPDAPVNVNISASAESLYLEWDDPKTGPSIAWYEIQINGGNWQNIGLPDITRGKRTYVITGLTGGEEYYISLRGVDESGQQGKGVAVSGIPLDILAGSGNVISTHVISLEVHEHGTDILNLSISTGYNHSFAIKEGGTVWAWGYNQSGQLGDGTKISRDAPVHVSGLTGVKQASAGSAHSIVVKGDGTVWAWGLNGYGQLGDGTKTSRTTPAQVTGLTGVKQVAAGERHCIALKGDGTVWAWGQNDYGQLGDGTKTNRYAPVQVTGLTGVIQISAGNSYGLALKEDGTAWAWGYNQNGQLGDGTTTDKNIPVQVTGLTGVIQISAGSSHSMALKEDGTAWAWGYNPRGQIGDGTTTNRNAPVQVTGLTGIIQISVGFSHSIALKEDGTVWAWGQNNYGQLGDGTKNNRYAPVKVSELAEAIQISAGYYHSIALKENGSIWVWGQNNYGQLGTGDNQNRMEPTLVDFISDMPVPIPTSIAFNALAGNEYDVVISSVEIGKFYGIEFILKYDNSVFDVIDLSRFTKEKELIPGKIKGTDLMLTHVGPGEIRFVVDKVIPQGKAYSGTIDIISFKAKKTENSTIGISIQAL